MFEFIRLFKKSKINWIYNKDRAEYDGYIENKKIYGIDSTIHGYEFYHLYYIKYTEPKTYIAIETLVDGIMVNGTPGYLKNINKLKMRAEKYVNKHLIELKKIYGTTRRMSLVKLTKELINQDRKARDGNL